jgi:hypothetical protein
MGDPTPIAVESAAMDDERDALQPTLSTQQATQDTSSTRTNDENDHTTYFLLDIQDIPSSEQDQPSTQDETKEQQHPRPKRKSKRRSSSSDGSSTSHHRRSSTSTSSTSSSMSAQVVIDHGHSNLLCHPHHHNPPPHASSSHRLHPHHAAQHILRSGDDESESDYAYSLSHHLPTNHPLQQPQHLDPHYYHHRPQQIPSPHFYASDNDHRDSIVSSDYPMLSRLSQEGSTRKQSYQQQQEQQQEIDDDDDDPKQHRMDGPESYAQDNHNDHDEHAIADDESDTHPKRSPPHLAHTDIKKKRKKKKIHRLNNNSRTSLPDSSCQSTPKHSSHYPRKLNKRAQRVLEANLHSHSWSRRESLRQPYEHPVVGLSSDEALQ